MRRRPGRVRRARVREHRLAELRAVAPELATFEPLARSMRRVGELEPALAVGLTYPFDRHGISLRRLLAPAVRGALVAVRATLPRRIGTLLARAGASVAVLQHLTVSARVVERAHALDPAVVAWTVDDPASIRRVDAAGVDAIVTNDPKMLRTTLDT